MSGVQRYEFVAPGRGNAIPSMAADGEFVTYADHARIVAEAGAAVFAFHPEWTVTGMCDPDCLACRRLTELITEREKGYEEGKADAEQEHAAALAEAVIDADTIPANLIDAWIEVGRKAAAPRTLTADDPEPAVGSIVMDRIGDPWRAFIGYGGVQVWASAGDIRSASWANLHRIVGPVTLIHDGEATPQVKPCSTCGEPVAYLTARPGWAGGWLHHPARPLDGHPAAIDGEATT